jgi:Protein of unknown function (DUF4199)/GyrI-like small molecule binding domain
LSRCRHDFLLELPDGLVPPTHFSIAERRAGFWAVAPVAGGIDGVDRAWSMLFKSWLPASGLDLRAEPAEEVYLKLPEDIGWPNSICCAASPLRNPGVERHTMRYNPITTYAGLFAGAGAALWTMFEFAMGWHNEHWETGAMAGFIAIIFPIAAIIWALRATKSSSGGQLTMKQSLMTGLSISAISAAIGAVFFYAYYTAINPAFIAAMRARPRG